MSRVLKTFGDIMLGWLFSILGFSKKPQRHEFDQALEVIEEYNDESKLRKERMKNNK